MEQRRRGGGPAGHLQAGGPEQRGQGPRRGHRRQLVPRRRAGRVRAVPGHPARRAPARRPAAREAGRAVPGFLPEDARCLGWLDARPDRSVVYVAFGSFTVFNPRQFEELALGLELTGRPFLWVVRPDFAAGFSKAWLDEFRLRVGGDTGLIVSWCPQQQVLAHRAVACFVSHCGWNSTMEGVRSGVPFVCWPYFTDQFLNEIYICNVWRTGLAMAPGADGVVTKEELSGKVERVLGNEGIRERVGVLRDAAWRSIAEGGSSHQNFIKFVELLKE
ncbi:unnamed protein product [Urochloa humidicola]